MAGNLLYLLILYNLLQFNLCGYPPTGDEVLPGSVLLPATRRGRYLANIVRRQAVDGTGIKFNKDADRMNAEAKKKVDVLSDELLPYIIAEQERRTTLYKRIMTAIQNGEKGITIAEIRNKPPLIIRKGSLYRCPANRAPKEPDGSGSMMCEAEIEPSQVLYDSCLSAEDKDLYVADNKYFFCNRRRVEGPDLPRNGSTVIGCAPIERTSLNYTFKKCTLEDTDDVVVHYRYYPDRTYKYVTELDPDHEVCDHWNPCQIGYIYSLPSSDQAVLANELWRNYNPRESDYERDEIIPPIPEDSAEEFVDTGAVKYESSARRIPIPDGFKFLKLWAKRHIDNYGWNPAQNKWGVSADVDTEKSFVTVKIKFPETFSEGFYGNYYAVFTKNGRRSSAKSVLFLSILPSMVRTKALSLQVVPGQMDNETLIYFKCGHCLIQGALVRTVEGYVSNLDSSKYRFREITDKFGRKTTYIEVFMNDLRVQELGDFFVIVQNSEGAQERIKILSAEPPGPGDVKIPRITASLAVGAHLDQSATYTCESCEMVDATCNGKSMKAAGRIAIVAASKMVNFNVPRYDDSFSCVYLGYFKNKDGKMLQKIVAVIENDASGVKVAAKAVEPPAVGDPYQTVIPKACSDAKDCPILNVTFNGVPLDTGGGHGSMATYMVNDGAIKLVLPMYTKLWAGVFQVVYSVGGAPVTKTVLEIKSGDGDDDGTASNTGQSTTPGNNEKSKEPEKGTEEKKEMSTEKKPGGR